MLNSRTKNNVFFISVIWAAFFGFVAKSLLGRVTDPDLWWHLAAGREMVTSHTILRTDIFSHTLYGTRWIDFEWLSQIALYGITSVAGFWGLIWFRALLSVSALMLLAWLCREKGARGAGLFFITGVAYWMLRPRLSERPELFTLNFLPLLLIFIEKARYAAPTSRTKFTAMIAGLFILWANLHGGFIYGLGMMILIWIGAWWADDAARPSDETRFLARTIVWSLMAVCVNPYGIRLVSVFVEHLNQLFFAPHLIDEWKPPSIQNLPLFWIAGLLVIFYLARDKSWLTGDARRWIPALLVFGAWGAFSYRNGPLFTFLALPFLSSRIRFPERGWRAGVLFLLPLFSLGYGVTAPLSGDPVQWRLVPQGACAYIQKHNLRGTLGHDYGYGGFLSWALGPDRKIMMDGRYIFYPLILDIEKATTPLGTRPDDPAWPALLDRYHIDTIITEFNDTPLRLGDIKSAFPLTVLNLFYPRSHWALVYWDDTSVIFLKRTPENEPFIREHAYNALWPYNLEQMKFLLSTNAIAPDAMQRELDRHQQETGFTFVERKIREELSPLHVAGT